MIAAPGGMRSLNTFPYAALLSIPDVVAGHAAEVQQIVYCLFVHGCGFEANLADDRRPIFQIFLRSPNPRAVSPPRKRNAASGSGTEEDDEFQVASVPFNADALPFDALLMGPSTGPRIIMSFEKFEV